LNICHHTSKIIWYYLGNNLHIWKKVCSFARNFRPKVWDGRTKVWDVRTKVWDGKVLSEKTKIAWQGSKNAINKKRKV